MDPRRTATARDMGRPSTVKTEAGGVGAAAGAEAEVGDEAVGAVTVGEKAAVGEAEGTNRRTAGGRTERTTVSIIRGASR